MISVNFIIFLCHFFYAIIFVPIVPFCNRHYAQAYYLFLLFVPKSGFVSFLVLSRITHFYFLCFFINILFLSLVLFSTICIPVLLHFIHARYHVYFPIFFVAEYFPIFQFPYLFLTCFLSLVRFILLYISVTSFCYIISHCVAHYTICLSCLYSTCQILGTRVLISVDAQTIIPLTPPKHHNKIPWQHHSFCVLSFSSYSYCFPLTDVSSVLPFIPAQNIILLPFYMLLSNSFSSLLLLHMHEVFFLNGFLSCFGRHFSFAVYFSCHVVCSTNRFSEFSNYTRDVKPKALEVRGASHHLA